MKLYKVVADSIKYSDNGSTTVTKKKGDIVEFKNPNMHKYLGDKVEEVKLDSKEVKDVAATVKLSEEHEALKKELEDLKESHKQLTEAYSECEKKLEKTEETLTGFASEVFKLEDKELLKLDENLLDPVAEALDVEIPNNVSKASTKIGKIKEAIK